VAAGTGDHPMDIGGLRTKLGMQDGSRVCSTTKNRLATRDRALAVLLTRGMAVICVRTSSIGSAAATDLAALDRDSDEDLDLSDAYITSCVHAGIAAVLDRSHMVP
jgi:hypothetical protein